LLDIVVFALDKPTALLCGLGEGGEYTLRTGGIAALDHEGVVDNGLLCHGGFLSCE